MAFKRATVTSLLAGTLLVATVSTASADVGWQETYRDFDNKSMCDLSALAWEAKYPYNDYECFQLSSGRWTMKYRLKG
ncbi:hypothetical protein KBZ94_42305 [Streptomyces sp. RM72]|uniref:hypothetical protein n=1 Tax=Streptomyces sp. RM72 TaxID=1115510 RepID=UPI001B386E1B|nr:hypothetical protein [Streptomyces sp. RM72]MBQ0891448.1 hypothetical protein [Streptomyces sp. RM72]